MAPVYSEYGIKRYIDETRRLISVLEIRLSKADWLAGDKYTLADIANFAWVRGAYILDIDLEKDFPGVSKWVKNIEGRDAVKKAKGVPEGAVMTDEQINGFMTQGKAKIDAMKGTDKQDN